MDYSAISPEAQTIFAAADLFGDGGKRYNAEFAALILRSAAEVLSNAYANELYPDHPDDFLRDIAAELDPLTSEENHNG